MTGQRCGVCGGSRMAEGCACRYAGDAEETAVIPVIGGPELVRPYIHPTEVLDDGPQDGYQAGYPVGYGAEADHGGGRHGDGHGDGDAHAAVYAPMAQPPDSPGYGLAAGPGTGSGLGSEAGSDAGYATQFDGGAQDGSGPLTVLHGTAVFPGQRRSGENGGVVLGQGADVTPYAPGRQSVALRASAARGAVSGRGVGSDRGGASGRGRRTALIAAGALAVAGLGTAAALVPRMFGNSTDQSLPGPSVTLALPSTGADSPSAAASAAGASATAAPSRTRATRPPSHSPTSRPSSAAASAPAQTLPPQPTATDSPPSSSPSSDAPSGGDTQTLQRGDTGAAVATLQTELSDLWIDPNLTIDGRYGSRTERDVETFQSWYNVTGDPPGVFGPYSQAKMNQLAGR